jgi:hypothetical protein
MQFHSVQSLESKLNTDNYSAAETVTFKFHLSIPYYTGHDGFARTEGQFEYHGEYYHLVKQKYSNDILELVCIKNNDSKQINVALKDFVKTFADQTGTSGKSVNPLTNFIKDYIAQVFTITHSSEGWSSTVYFIQSDHGKPNSFQTEISQPPELA